MFIGSFEPVIREQFHVLMNEHIVFSASPLGTTIQCLRCRAELGFPIVDENRLVVIIALFFQAIEKKIIQRIIIIIN